MRSSEKIFNFKISPHVILVSTSASLRINSRLVDLILSHSRESGNLATGFPIRELSFDKSKSKLGMTKKGKLWRSGTGFKEQVYELVKKIPKGKVLTYGQIAEHLGKRRWSRQVGWALHKNKEGSGVPCHCVVDRNGRLAPNFAFEGAKEQRRRLEAEGVKFIDDIHVDLRRFLCKSI